MIYMDEFFSWLGNCRKPLGRSFCNDFSIDDDDLFFERNDEHSFNRIVSSYII